MKTITVAVIGNPNTGKSTLINAIAGTRLQVGNWPGVTVEKKTATLEIDGLIINLVDLPGIYSLTPYTQEEKIAMDFLIKEKPDLIIDVIDATNLERNLYLLLQILELEIPVIIALNMFDEAKKKNIKIDIKKLEEILKVKIVPTVATKEKGIKELLTAIKNIAQNKEFYKPEKLNYGDKLENALSLIKNLIKKQNPALFDKYPDRWLCLKLLEKDAFFLEKLDLPNKEEFLEKLIEIINSLQEIYKEDIELILAEARYGVAHGIVQETTHREEKARLDLTEKIDKVVLNRILGIPIFLIIMWFVFKLAFDFGGPFCDWIDGFIGFISKWISIELKNIGVAPWINSLIVDGIIGGVGAVLVFLPLIGIFMLVITFLEGSGYLSRAAFVMDKVMHRLGLHGKSFIPLIIGFGCNVPSIYATRTLETNRDRELTALICPCMSCSARLPVYVLFAGLFFAKYGGTIIWSLYILGVFIAIFLGTILNKTLYKGIQPIFVMELPPYRIPTLKYLIIYTWEKLKHFLIKAGTFILVASVLIWSLLNIPYGVPKDKTLLAKVGKAISPIFVPLGFGKWEATSALLTGIIAKEVIISTMAEIYGDSEEEIQENMSLYEDIKTQIINLGITFKKAFKNMFLLKPSVFEAEKEEGRWIFNIKKDFTPLSAYSYLVFILLYWPCMVFAFTLRAEFGWKLLGKAILIYTMLPWLVSFLIYNLGKLWGFA